MWRVHMHLPVRLYDLYVSTATRVAGDGDAYEIEYTAAQVATICPRDHGTSLLVRRAELVFENATVGIKDVEVKPPSTTTAQAPRSGAHLRIDESVFVSDTPNATILEIIDLAT